jgi:hypothetical protein
MNSACVFLVLLEFLQLPSEQIAQTITDFSITQTLQNGEIHFFEKLTESSTTRRNPIKEFNLKKD